MTNKKDIERIEQEMTSILAKLEEDRNGIQKCKKDFEETLNVIREKFSVESKQLTEITQHFQQLFNEIPQLLRQYISLLVKWNENYEIKNINDVEEYSQMAKKLVDGLNDFLMRNNK